MNVREWVHNALCEVIQKHTYSNLYLKDHLHEVEQKDQALASNIFYGTLQNYALCESAWKRFAKGKVSRKAGILLTMSVYQLLFLKRVPDYAVIDEANRIAVHQFPALRAMINAILRKVASTPLELPENPIERLALSTSLPSWLVTLWAKQYGKTEAFQFAKAATAALPVTVRRNPLRLSAKEAAAISRLIPLDEEGRVLAMSDSAFKEGDEPVLYRYTGTSIGSDPLYKSGAISVQDPGSYAIAKAADVKPGMKILDLCAAPGTKSMAMAEMSNDQAKILSLDLHEHRVRLIENDARRLHLQSIQAETADSSALPENPIYDVVLADVPCSGLGVLSRKPDIKLKLKPALLDEMTPVQKAIADAGAGQLKDGGLLVYSTCTLNKKENEKQVEDFLERHPDFTLLDEKTIMPNEEHGGFFIARLRKNASSK